MSPADELPQLEPTLQAGGEQPTAEEDKTCVELNKEVKKELVEVDGSLLEGGGQVVRLVCAYSALFGLPVHLTNIRATRKRGGLAAQHVTGLRLVQDVCSGSLQNDNIGSQEVTFLPNALAPGEFRADLRTSASIALLVQAVLVPLFFTGGYSACCLCGGTDVEFSPSLDFLTAVLQPILERMGALFNVECLGRGVFPGAGGKVILQVAPLPPGTSLSPVELHVPGTPVRAEVVLYTTRKLEQLERANAIAALHERAQELAAELNTRMEVVEGPDGAEKFWLDVVVTTTSGAIFHAGCKPTDLPRRRPLKGFGDDDELCSKMKELVGDAIRQACDNIDVDIAGGYAIGKHLLDQLILPATLAKGTSKFLAPELSLHTLTAIAVAEQMVPGAVITEERQGELSYVEVEGIGYEAPDRAMKATQPTGQEAAMKAFASRATTPKSAARPKTPGGIPAGNQPKRPPAQAKRSAPLFIPAASPLSVPPTSPMSFPPGSPIDIPFGTVPKREARPPILGASLKAPPPSPTVQEHAAVAIAGASLKAVPKRPATPVDAELVCTAPVPMEEDSAIPESLHLTTAASSDAADPADLTPDGPAPCESPPNPPSPRQQEPQEIILLPREALTTAGAEMLRDFRADLEQLGAESRARIELDSVDNRLILYGQASGLDKARALLKDMLAFYFPSKP